MLLRGFFLGLGDCLCIGGMYCRDVAVGMCGVDLFAECAGSYDVVPGQPDGRVADEHVGVTVEDHDSFNLHQCADEDIAGRQIHRPGVHAGVQRVLRRDLGLRNGRYEVLDAHYRIKRFQAHRRERTDHGWRCHANTLR